MSGSSSTGKTGFSPWPRPTPSVRGTAFPTAARAFLPSAWEQKHPGGVSFEDVRQLFCRLAVSVDMGVFALKNVIETSTSSEGKRLAQQHLAENLELQSRTMVPEEAPIRISAWTGLTPKEYGEASKRVAEASIVLLKSMQ